MVVVHVVEVVTPCRRAPDPVTVALERRTRGGEGGGKNVPCPDSEGPSPGSRSATWSGLGTFTRHCDLDDWQSSLFLVVVLDLLCPAVRGLMSSPMCAVS